MTMSDDEMAEWDAYIERIIASEGDWDDAHDHAVMSGDVMHEVPASVIVFAPSHPEIDVIPAHTCDHPGVTTMCAACSVIAESRVDA